MSEAREAAEAIIADRIQNENAKYQPSSLDEAKERYEEIITTATTKLRERVAELEMDLQAITAVPDDNTHDTIQATAYQHMQRRLIRCKEIARAALARKETTDEKR